MTNKTEKYVLVADEISQEGLEILGQGLTVVYDPTITQDKLISTINQYHGLLVRSRAKVSLDVITQANKLKVIGRAGVGVDNIDVNSATKKGIVVLNSPEGNTASAAEHTIALMMSLARNIPMAYQSLKDLKWLRSEYTGVELFNKTLGIIGLGKIGKRVAQVANSLGMKVISFDPLLDCLSAKALNIDLVSLEEIWKYADFITIHTPKTTQTTNLINHSVFGRLKPGVRIINTSRGGIIDENALALAIQEGKVAGAALDVFETEPLIDSPLFEFKDKVILTPHLAASTFEAQLNVALDLAQQINDFLIKGIAKSPVNLPFLKPEILQALGQFLKLAQAMGAISASLTDGSIKEIEVSASGKITKYDTTSLAAAAIKGVLNNRIEGLNYVNAFVIATDHGINIRQAKFSESDEQNNALSVVISGKSSFISIEGTVLGADKPMITKINHFSVNLAPSRFMLFTIHHDQPGMVAKVATVLGDNQKNISSMSVNRKLVGKEAMMVIELDEILEDDLLATLNNIDGIKQASFVNLNDWESY